MVLCTGYVMPSIVRPTIQRPTSSWAIAHAEPQPRNLWPEDVLIWEASTTTIMPAAHPTAGSSSEARMMISPSNRRLARHSLPPSENA